MNGLVRGFNLKSPSSLRLIRVHGILELTLKATRIANTLPVALSMSSRIFKTPCAHAQGHTEMSPVVALSVSSRCFIPFRFLRHFCAFCG